MEPNWAHWNLQKSATHKSFATENLLMKHIHCDISFKRLWHADSFDVPIIREKMLCDAILRKN